MAHFHIQCPCLSSDRRRLPTTAASAAFGGSSGIDWVRLHLDLALARAVEEEDYERAAQVQADLALLQRCQTEELATELLRRCKGMHSDWSKNVGRTARDS